MGKKGITITSRILYMNTPITLSFQFDVAEKGIVGLLGAERFRVILVPLSHNGLGKRRDGLVGKRIACELATAVLFVMFMMEIAVVSLQVSLVISVVIPISCRLNNAFESLNSTIKYRYLIAEGGIFIYDTGTALLI